MPEPALAVGEATNGFPNWEERVLHQWMNRARSDPQVEMAACGSNCPEASCYSPIAPLAYSLNLNRAARFHADAMVRQSFFAHDSACTVVSNINSTYPSTCNGSASCACVGGTKTCSPTCTSWSSRVALFGSSTNGEIIASPSDPNSAFYLWLFEPFNSSVCAFSFGPPTNGHRWNILKITGSVGAGVAGYSVGDFGSTGTAAKIPSGSHYPRQSASVGVWANWYDTAAPSVARVNVGGVCTPMTVGRGAGGNASYTATLTNVASGCHRYYFEFKDSTNAAVTYPTTGSLGIGPAGSCADWDATRPLACDTPPSYLLTVGKAGAGTGTVTSVTPAGGINCGGDCTENYTAATSVTLGEAPDPGSAFASWTGCDSVNGSSQCVLAMNAARSVTATFNLLPTAPGAPTIGTATPGDGAALITFAPPASNGGSPITGYVATCNPGGITGTGAASPVTVGALSNGAPYTCSVAAINAIGTGASSGTVGVTPSGSAPLALVAVQSRKTQGAAGTFDLPIDTAQAIGGAVTVDPRSIGAGHVLVFQFNGAITATGTAATVNAAASAVGTATPAISGNDVIVTLTGIPDNQRVTVSLTNVNGAALNVAASVGFLVGDVNGSRSVTATDILQVKGRSGQNVDSSNFPYDVNASGSITATDILAVKGRSGLAIP